MPDQRCRAKDRHSAGTQLPDHRHRVAVQEPYILEVQLHPLQLVEVPYAGALEYGNPVGHERALDLERYHLRGLASSGDPNHGCTFLVRVRWESSRTPDHRAGSRTPTASKSNVTRSATFTAPPTGLMPKSVCFTLNVPRARRVSGPTWTVASTGTGRAWRTCVRIVSVTFRISAVSGGVSSSRLSVGMVIS